MAGSSDVTLSIRGVMTRPPARERVEQRDDGEARISGRRVDGGGPDPLSDILGATRPGSSPARPAAAEADKPAAPPAAPSPAASPSTRRPPLAGGARGAAAAAATGPGDDAALQRGRQQRGRQAPGVGRSTIGGEAHGDRRRPGPPGWRSALPSVRRPARSPMQLSAEALTVSRQADQELTSHRDERLRVRRRSAAFRADAYASSARPRRESGERAAQGDGRACRGSRARTGGTRRQGTLPGPASHRVVWSANGHVTARRNLCKIARLSATAQWIGLESVWYMSALIPHGRRLQARRPR